MRTWISAFAALCLLSTPALRAQSPEERTRQALDLVLKRKYEAFYAQFAPEMKKAISLKDYSTQCDQLFAIRGKPASIGTPEKRAVPEGGTNISIPIHWSTVDSNFLVSWNRAGQVQDTWILDAPPPPPYVHPDRFTARDVTIGDDEWKLPGTLLTPKGAGPFPALVLVHGSGPHDRDETVGGAKPFRDLAEGLAGRGIAVLRYEKRTLVYPAECAKDPNFTMTRETVDDAIRAAALLRTQPGIDPKRIFVLGHSQGGYLMPRIMHADASLAGVVVLAGNSRRMEDLILEQTDYLLRLNGEPTPAQQKQLDALARDPWLAVPGLPEFYKNDLKGYNPVELAKTSAIPMLVLQGERDYQVTMKDFALWKSGLAERPGVTFQSFPKLNHLFVSGEGKSTPKEYSQPGHVAPEVIDTIAVWIGKTAPAPR